MSAKPPFQRTTHNAHHLFSFFSFFFSSCTLSKHGLLGKKAVIKSENELSRLNTSTLLYCTCPHLHTHTHTLSTTRSISLSLTQSLTRGCTTLVFLGISCCCSVALPTFLLFLAIFTTFIVMLLLLFLLF